jgi:hypothetical protein
MKKPINLRHELDRVLFYTISQDLRNNLRPCVSRRIYNILSYKLWTVFGLKISTNLYNSLRYLKKGIQ